MVGRLYHLSPSESKARAKELLAEFSLTDAGGRVAGTYSGGMRRRLDLAAALVVRPPVLFLDEPTASLDPSAKREVEALLASLREAGVRVEDLEIGRADLEDVFVEIMQSAGRTESRAPALPDGGAP